MKKNILSIATLLILTLGFAACSNNSEKTSTEQSTNSETYQCPMQCEGDKTYEKAGQCPVCKMDLEKAGETHSHDSDHQH